MMVAMEGWYVLALAIVSPEFLNPEQAFNSFESARPLVQHRKLTKQDVQDMIKLKEKLTYKQIGEIYGMKACAVYNRIRRFKGLI